LSAVRDRQVELPHAEWDRQPDGKYQQRRGERNRGLEIRNRQELRRLQEAKDDDNHDQGRYEPEASSRLEVAIWVLEVLDVLEVLGKLDPRLNGMSECRPLSRRSIFSCRHHIPLLQLSDCSTRSGLS
jgi:hypothetical protein